MWTTPVVHLRSNDFIDSLKIKFQDIEQTMLKESKERAEFEHMILNILFLFLSAI